MFSKIFLEVIAHEGAVSIATCANGEAHLACTWNSYLNVKGEDKLLIPAAFMKTTEANININPKVKIALGSKEVMGMYGMGAGFSIEGTAKFYTSGEDYDMMKAKFPFLDRLLEVTVTSLKQVV